MTIDDAQAVAEFMDARALRVLLIIDPIDTLHPGHDTSVAIMEAAQVRGHSVAVATIDQLWLDDSVARARCSDVVVVPAVLEQGRWTAIDDWYTLGVPADRSLNDFDVVLMRTDPPVDEHYLRATFILDYIDAGTTLLVNSPAGLRNANEKLFGLRFAGTGPATVITADREVIVERVRRWGRAVLKPTDAMAGRGILVLTPDDPNLHSILDGATDHGTRQVVVQRWIEEATDGDRRIILIDGTPVGSVRRVALGDDFRCNMAAGAVTVADAITDADRALCAQLAPQLRAHGLVFVGIDVIGDRLTEINVTSPTGVREIAALSGTDIAGQLVAWAEQTHCARVNTTVADGNTHDDNTMMETTA